MSLMVGPQTVTVRVLAGGHQTDQPLDQSWDFEPPWIPERGNEARNWVEHVPDDSIGYAYVMKVLESEPLDTGLMELPG